MFIPLILDIDGYKLGHIYQLPHNMEEGYGNVTPRAGRNPQDSGVIVFGTQFTVMELLERKANEFFAMSREDVAKEYDEFVKGYLGVDVTPVDRILELHDLGYLPIEVRALPEGTFVPYGVPMVTVKTTGGPRFAWLCTYIETAFNSYIWLPTTSATTARSYRKTFDEWALKTVGNTDFSDWQGHDFSFRGMQNPDAAAASGAGHLLSFAGTDTIPAIYFLRKYYGAEGLVAGSVPATEHSVMCAGGKETEKETIIRLMETYPTGILSVVSDTWDFWQNVTVDLVELKDKIMSRDGKYVVRPDSGDPVKILVGDPDADPSTPEFKGLIEVLGDIFGYTVTEKGYKVLDPHIGAIYGDSITKARQDEILAGLAAKGWASTNVVLGIGSFTYGYVTRDTHGFAMKMTHVVIDGEGKSIYKEPKTDKDGFKKSARGYLQVVEDENGNLVLVNDADTDDGGLLQVIWRDGKRIRWATLTPDRKFVYTQVSN